ncbi:hypothetical protein FBU30_006234 [Linnemannia zychae]|nr:hypothetical protein FBU30_006234 [Linnemannia zychae]
MYMEEDELDGEDYYDPHDDLADFHDQKLRIEESWLEWERQTSVNNRQSNGFHNFNIFQKPGSVKRRDRRGRAAQFNAQTNRSGASSSSSAATGFELGSGGNPGNSAAIEKLRHLGTFRPDMANSIVHSYSTLSWEAIQAARERRLAAKAELNNTGHRVLWGLSTGQVSLTILSYSTAGQSFQTFSGFHNGPVSCVKLVPNHLGFVLTGGVDGVVRLWDVVKARTIREFRTGFSLTGARTRTIEHICCEPGSYIIAGTSGGEIYIWDVDINSLVTPIYATANGVSSPARSTSSDTTTQSTPPSTPGVVVIDGEIIPEPDLATTPPKVIMLPEEFKGVHYLEVDFGLDGRGLILAQASDSKVMHLYSLETQEHLAVLKSPAHLSVITAVHWDIPKHEKPMISLSNASGSKTQHTLHTLYGRHDTPSLLATGDNSGNICLWYLSDITKLKLTSTQEHLHPSQIQHETPILSPSCVLRAHDARVTSLSIDKLIMVSGSADGWIKAWNPVNGKLVSVLNTGYIRGREANDPTSLVNRCMVVDGPQCRGVVSVGSLIRCWDFSPEANLTKEKYRKGAAKKPMNYSAGYRTKIQDDIRHSLEETVSLKRLENQVKERQQQLQKRFNNLQGLNMVDMTDDEVVEYVMMLSREHGDQNSGISASELQQIQELEQQDNLERRLRDEFENGGEGYSLSAAMSASPTIQIRADNTVTEQELAEEEELVRRAIELSMLDAELAGNVHDHHNDDYGKITLLDSSPDVLDTAHSYQPQEWDSTQVIDVDSQVHVNQMSEEDQTIVNSILKELQEEEDHQTSPQKSYPSASPVADDWPSIGKTLPSSESIHSSSLSSSLSSSSTTAMSPSQAALTKSPEPVAKKMTWSMVARTHSNSSLGSSSSQSNGPGQGVTEKALPAGRQPAIIRQYSQNATQEEIEDEETQLARILSLSMVEK